jgi:hypothetical protein
MANVRNIKAQIVSEVTTVTNTQLFQNWLANENVSQSRSQFIAINNSFLFRDNIKTVKSEKYIAFDITSAKTFTVRNVYIVEGISFTGHFKLFTLATNHIKTDMLDAIKDELREIGEVIYTIVGDIQDTNNFSETLANNHFREVILNPIHATDFEIIDDKIIIKDYNNREQIWENIKAHCITNALDIAENLPSLIDKAITNFQNDAFSTLTLPNTFDPNTKYLLDKITLVIDDHLTTYRANISNINTDPKAMVEILRISYNFVSDVNKLLTMVINICDLKPIILWLTLSKYLILDNKFKELPFGFSVKKPSLGDYENIIKNARNRSFHQLFPFNKSLKFELNSLKEVSVTIFSNHGKKNGNQMTYKDQKLYDVLRSFTRTNEQLVSSNFWIKNECVMQAIHELINATSNSIKVTK